MTKIEAAEVIYRCTRHRREPVEGQVSQFRSDSMTELEAAEIILQGEEPFKVCVSCAGYGAKPGPVTSVLCPQCSGLGKKVNRQYVAACELLKIPLPKIEGVVQREREPGEDEPFRR